MRILLSFEITCPPLIAWRALHSPQVVADLYGPLLRLTALSPLPEQWQDGDDAVVALSLAGILPLGRQLISLSDHERQRGGHTVRILRDAGMPLTGMLAALTVWDHQMAVSPAASDVTRTLWQERLVIGGALAPLAWPVLWVLWQWRAARIRRLAHGWDTHPALRSEGPQDPAG